MLPSTAEMPVRFQSDKIYMASNPAAFTRFGGKTSYRLEVLAGLRLTRLFNMPLALPV